MKQVTRRDFFKTSAVAAAMATAIPVVSVSKPVWAQAPSDRLRLGCIGLGQMGRGDAADFNRLTDIVAICDVDENYGIANALRMNLGKRVGKGNVVKPDAYKDYRRILERNDIDVVCIATPDHWHVKIAVEALMAGKHVFCQKPLTLTLEENQIIRRACEKYQKTFQIGTWRRCQKEQFVKATLLVRKGYIGEVKKITCDLRGCPTSGDIPKRDVPASLDWEMWQGPAPRYDFLADMKSSRSNGVFGDTRCHRMFRYWYEYSGGKFTDWGAHYIDAALWAINLQTQGTGPVSFDGTNAHHPVEFKDGYPTVDNRYNASDSFDIKALFENGLEMHVVSNSPDGDGVLFEGTKGRIHVNQGRCKGKPVEELPRDAFTEDDYRELFHGKPFEGHKENFIRCIREGGICISDVVSHVQAMNVCHLCTIAARLNRVVKWDPKTETIVGDEQAASFYSRQETKGYEIPRDF